MPRSHALLALAAIASLSACAGPPIPAPLDNIPVCADFESGHTKMEGSLRYPVRLRVLDGKDQIAKIVIVGLRRAEDMKPHTFIVDDNAEYNLEWSQCSNERAPRTVSDAAHDSGKGKDKMRESDTAYDCGEATVYKTEKLVTKKRDAASHVIKFVEPPKPACWVSDIKAPPSPPPVMWDAGAPDPAADAGAVASDAGAAAADAGAVAADAGAAPSGTGTAAPTAKPDAKPPSK